MNKSGNFSKQSHIILKNESKFYKVVKKKAKFSKNMVPKHEKS